MPKRGANAVGAVAAGTGEQLGKSADPVEAIVHQQVRAPGQLGILAIDPGDKHVGMAVGLAFARPGPDGEVVASDELRHAFEVGHIDGLMAIDTAVNAGWVDILVIEDWQIYRDKVQELVGSRCETARFLGAVEHIVRKHNRWVESGNGAGPTTELVEQPASVQNVAKGKLREYRIDRTSKPTERHALSAELHFWHLVLGRRGLVG